MINGGSTAEIERIRTIRKFFKIEPKNALWSLIWMRRSSNMRKRRVEAIPRTPPTIVHSPFVWVFSSMYM